MSIQTQKNYLAYLIDSIFQGVYTLFILSFENNTDSIISSIFQNPNKRLQCYEWMKKIFWLSIQNDTNIYKKICKRWLCIWLFTSLSLLKKT